MSYVSMRYIKLTFLLLCLPLFCFSQNGENTYTFLRIPSSSRAVALGGHTVSLVESEPALIFHNPALLGGEMDNIVNVNYLNYFSGVNIGSAVYTRAFRERSSIGGGITYINYGNFQETNINGEEL